MADLRALLRDLDRLHEQATPAEWDVVRDYADLQEGFYSPDGEYVGEAFERADESFIVALRNAYPLLREALEQVIPKEET